MDFQFYETKEDVITDLQWNTLPLEHQTALPTQTEQPKLRITDKEIIIEGTPTPETLEILARVIEQRSEQFLLSQKTTVDRRIAERVGNWSSNWESLLCGLMLSLLVATGFGLVIGWGSRYAVNTIQQMEVR